MGFLLFCFFTDPDGLSLHVNRPLYHERSFLDISAPNVTLEAFKAAQDGNGLILRINETERRHTRAVITLPFIPAKVFETNLMEENEREVPFTETGFAVSLKPFEVKTFRIVQ